MRDEDDWADFDAAVFHPLADDDRGLADRLTERFLRRVVVDMTPAERAYENGWKAPRFEVGTTPKGSRLLVINFAGGRSVTEWDGSEDAAQEIVDSDAERSAYDSEWDYWVQGGGWKEWRAPS